MYIYHLFQLLFEAELSSTYYLRTQTLLLLGGALHYNKIYIQHIEPSLVWFVLTKH